METPQQQQKQWGAALCHSILNHSLQCSGSFPAVTFPTQLQANVPGRAADAHMLPPMWKKPENVPGSWNASWLISLRWT